MKRTYLDYLLDMTDSIEKVVRFTTEIDYAQFSRDDKTVFAVCRALEVIGEAANKIPTEVQNKFLSFPWQMIVGMRNKLIYEYFGVDIRVVWKTSKEDLPRLKPAIDAMISTLTLQQDSTGI